MTSHESGPWILRGYKTRADAELADAAGELLARLVELTDACHTASHELSSRIISAMGEARDAIEDATEVPA